MGHAYTAQQVKKNQNLFLKKCLKKKRKKKLKFVWKLASFFMKIFFEKTALNWGLA